ncbi:hypothetical protein GmHk_01G001262 [Glycine max]|nr:hypothetical protein GmHk_01G001262 [Glycine max]
MGCIVTLNGIDMNDIVVVVPVQLLTNCRQRRNINDMCHQVMLILSDPHHMIIVGKRQGGRKNDMRGNLSSSTLSPSTSNVAPTSSPTPTKVRPSTFPIDARRLSLVPTSTPSPSSTVTDMPTNEDIPNLVTEAPPPLLNDRPTVVTKAITLSIRQQFGNPWPTMGSNSRRSSQTTFRVENLFGDPRKRMTLGKLLTRKPLIDFPRCLGMPEMKITILDWRLCLELFLGIIPSVHRQKKIMYLKMVGVCTQSEELDRSAYVDEEDFEARLSEARFDATSSVGESQITPLDPTEEERLRTRCSVVAAGTKRKGCLHGTGELAHTYKCGDDCFMQHMQGSSNHAQDSIEIN